MDTYVLVHGAWHNGELLKNVAEAIELDGHKVHTNAEGNQDGDSKNVGLNDAIDSLISYIKHKQHRGLYTSGSFLCWNGHYWSI